MKKLTCVVLVLMIIMSCISVTATATQANVLHFDVNSTGWTNFNKIYCHIWEYDGEPFYAWQSKGEACIDKDGDNIWTYDLDAKGVYLNPEKQYVVIFSSNQGDQTYNLLLHSSVIGDTAFCILDECYEAPSDDTKKVQAAFWESVDAQVLGPEKRITSIGNVIGRCVPWGVTSQGMLESFLLNDLENARRFSGKNDQKLIDDIALELDLVVENVIEAIENTGVEVEWSKYLSLAHHGATSDRDATEDQPATPDQFPHSDKFTEHCNGHSHSYSGPLYYHYEEGKDEPSWFVARGATGGAACMVIYGVFGDYCLQNAHIEAPSRFNWHIYIFEDEKFYAIEDIWEDGFADKEALFSEFLVPNGYADMVGDADGDDGLSILDATEIQMQLAGLHEPEERIYGHIFGDHIFNRCDFDRDEEVSVLDATAIQMHLAGLD